MANTATERTRIGVCGFAEAQSRLFNDFGMMEVQKTFYQPPRVATAEGWRARAPERFTFAVKAWQLITHEASSPTYRRLREALSAQARQRAGAFRWNRTTQWAWERTQEIAEALAAEAVVFQTPKRFEPTPANLRQLYGFFESASRLNRRMVFEPRGEAWTDELMRRIVADLDLVHGVDPFLRRPVGRGMRYFRLHGRPAYRYRYRYSDADLDALVGMLSRAWSNRVLFNNDSMAADARRLLRRLA